MTKHWQLSAICWHTDPDEAFLVGTRESYIRMANILLKLADTDPSHVYPDKLDEVSIGWDSEGNYLTESGLDIVLSGIGIVEKAEDVIKVVNYFRQLNGNLPLAEE
jgi:hypothetical protein